MQNATAAERPLVKATEDDEDLYCVIEFWSTGVDWSAYSNPYIRIIIVGHTLRIPLPEANLDEMRQLQIEYCNKKFGYFKINDLSQFANVEILLCWLESNQDKVHDTIDGKPSGILDEQSVQSHEEKISLEVDQNIKPGDRCKLIFCFEGYQSKAQLIPMTLMEQTAHDQLFVFLRNNYKKDLKQLLSPLRTSNISPVCSNIEQCTTSLTGAKKWDLEAIICATLRELASTLSPLQAEQAVADVQSIADKQDSTAINAAVGKMFSYNDCYKYFYQMYVKAAPQTPRYERDILVTQCLKQTFGLSKSIESSRAVIKDFLANNGAVGCIRNQTTSTAIVAALSNSSISTTVTVGADIGKMSRSAQAASHKQEECIII